jgi:hypothetical protein
VQKAIGKDPDGEFEREIREVFITKRINKNSNKQQTINLHNTSRNSRISS